MHRVRRGHTKSYVGVIIKCRPTCQRECSLLLLLLHKLGTILLQAQNFNCSRPCSSSSRQSKWYVGRSTRQPASQPAGEGCLDTRIVEWMVCSMQRRVSIPHKLRSRRRCGVCERRRCGRWWARGSVALKARQTDDIIM